MSPQPVPTADDFQRGRTEMYEAWLMFEQGRHEEAAANATLDLAWVKSRRAEWGIG